MDKKALEYFYQAQSRLASVCIRVYEDGSLKNLLHFIGSSAAGGDIGSIPLNMDTGDLFREKSIAVFDESQFILGYLQDKRSGNVILIGPVRMGEITSKDIFEIMAKYRLPKVLENSITYFLLSTPIISIENFLTLLSMFYLVINDEIVTIRQIMQENANFQSQQENADYIETVDIELPRGKGDYEAAVSYYIKNGMLDEIEKLQYEDFGGQVGKLGPSQLRSLKNALIILNSICLRAAISGGLDTETAYGLGERYAQRIEKAASLPELGNLSPMIRKDYCQRVKNLAAPKIDNLHIHKATEYIQNNIYTKITVRDLAGKIGVSPEYLAALSKQYLKCTLSEYINKAKVTEAKKLLRFTDKSLANIAVLLSFSSQSHFQNQFKKIRGITPTEYRKKYQVNAKKQSK